MNPKPLIWVNRDFRGPFCKFLITLLAFRLEQQFSRKKLQGEAFANDSEYIFALVRNVVWCWYEVSSCCELKAPSVVRVRNCTVLTVLWKQGFHIFKCGVNIAQVESFFGNFFSVVEIEHNSRNCIHNQWSLLKCVFDFQDNNCLDIDPESTSHHFHKTRSYSCMCSLRQYLCIWRSRDN